jgi:hypothetical protein
LIWTIFIIAISLIIIDSDLFRTILISPKVSRLRSVAERNHSHRVIDLGYDCISLAILRRHLPSLKRLVVSGAAGDIQDGSRRRGKFSLAELALGWEGGLRYLVKKEFSVVKAIQTATELLDAESLAVLLTSPQPLFSTDEIIKFSVCGGHSTLLSVINTSAFRPLSNPQSAESISAMVVSEFKRRRIKLRDLAIENLPPYNLGELGLGKHTFLDANVVSTYAHLAQVTVIPEELDCRVSPYEFDSRLPELTLLNALYEGGFKATDIPDTSGHTPLFRALSRVAARDAFRFSCQPVYEVATWFLEHGASPESSKSEGQRGPGSEWPTALFYLALLTGDHQFLGVREYFSQGTSARLLRTLHLVRDSCVCFCGQSGCLPTHLLSRNHSVRGCDCTLLSRDRREMESSVRRHLFRSWVRA